ncbi:choice-of-anchor L domain-containing protein [Phaeodactylibacter xiamenensis]|uniref:choice-of-anchor L domain-containing protein n=1 Tax=Phaeodactylibacter xiamenensis TaxID=1524460 RepID=UPI0024A85D61|nr:choice-of-anchor L domain-containing protein [Phaeodactylibacter xiamenensis]
MKMRFFTILSLLFLTGALYAQAPYTVIGSLDSTFTPVELIEDVCLGEGIEVTNIQFEGVSPAVGRFLGGSDIIGLEQGFLMTTGLAQSSGNFGGADMASFGDASFINNSNAYTEEIATISNNSTIRDVAIFRINFVPTGDTLMFRYVFASDEYPNFVCSNFNDVFGFFLEGTDPETGTSAIRNLAQIPGTELPVSINSINNGVPGGYPGSHPAWCSEEFNGSLDYANLFNQVPPFVAPSYNGFTDVLLAKADVVPCQEYQMTLVIADVGDAWWDSGIYFEANSFCSFSGSHGTTERLTITEDCAPQELEVGLSLFPEEEYPLTYTITGGATAGVGLAGIPFTGSIDEIADTWLLPIDIMTDSLAQGADTLSIEIKGATCREKVFELTILDPLLIEGPSDAAACAGDPVTLTATHDSTLLADFDFSWSNGMTGASIEVNPPTTTTYTLTYGNAAGTCTQDYTVFVTPLESEITVSINEGQSYLFANQNLTAAGTYEEAFTAANGCDSLVQLTLLVKPIAEVLTDSIAIGQEGTLCVNTDLFQSVDSFTEACGNIQTATLLTDPTTACATYTGLQTGQDTLCFLACGNTGLCDTTYLVLSVFTNLLDAVDDYDTTAYDESKIIDVLSNDWISSTTLTDQYLVSLPETGIATLNPDGSILYEPDLSTCLQEESFSYAICNDIGCDTATVFLFLDETEGQCDLVWPGDVGNDGIVNQMDQWAIGLAYGREGIVRANASIDWVGQYALNWPSTITFAYEFNAKYGDCNGDGFITADDMEAIEQNWGLTHPLAPIVPFSFPEKEQPKSLGPVAESGGQYRIPVYLGEISQPVQDAYGLSFTLRFEPGTLTHLHFEAQEGAFHSAHSPLLNLVRVETDKAIVSIVRTNQEGVELTGYIGDLLANNPNFTISDWILLQSDGDVFALPGDVAPTAITGTHQTGLSNALALRAYPVPAQGEIFVETNEPAMATVFNASGQLIWSAPLRTGVQRLSVADWQPGVYLLRAEGKENVAYTRILVNR